MEWKHTDSRMKKKTKKQTNKLSGAVVNKEGYADGFLGHEGIHYYFL